MTVILTSAVQPCNRHQNRRGQNSYWPLLNVMNVRVTEKVFTPYLRTTDKLKNRFPRAILRQWKSPEKAQQQIFILHVLRIKKAAL
ncbi:hypothetical protein Cpha266_0210 [Chlorobium phaeobacteroides DSM 266]|uniref:Uncharacterized protein n=1 Tax=Chlorobium phaeobacteroides (strain DSM 266 / SMG 266 / 2430) TaxID=290317 RepID=A1BD00_CHLPD|nr:hypothetical protein Cpha266_0210 [Chlorobium phaeobacteroides DSM 266]